MFGRPPVEFRHQLRREREFRSAGYVIEVVPERHRKSGSVPGRKIQQRSESVRCHRFIGPSCGSAIERLPSSYSLSDPFSDGCDLGIGREPHSSSNRPGLA